LGEQPQRVFNVGTPGLDNIFRLKLLDKPQLEEAIDFKLGKRNLLVSLFRQAQKLLQIRLSIAAQLLNMTAALEGMFISLRGLYLAVLLRWATLFI
jgi:hypothetical protein